MFIVTRCCALGMCAAGVHLLLGMIGVFNNGLLNIDDDIDLFVGSHESRRW